MTTNGGNGNGHAEPRNAWERQPRETGKAFNAFICYRDLPAAGRSCAEVSRKLGNHVKTVEKWSRTYDWVSRVLAWDEQRDVVRRAAALSAVEAAAKRQVSLGIHLQVIAKRAAQALAPAGQETLSEPITPHALARLADIGAKLERRALGLPTEIIEPPPPEVPVDPEHEEDVLAPYLTDPDVAEACDRLAAAMENFAGGDGRAPEPAGPDPVDEG